MGRPVQSLVGINETSIGHNNPRCCLVIPFMLVVALLPRALLRLHRPRALLF